LAPPDSEEANHHYQHGDNHVKRIFGFEHRHTTTPVARPERSTLALQARQCFEERCMRCAMVFASDFDQAWRRICVRRSLGALGARLVL
jgi:hypothetical protein